jgi:hypothetical protein
LNVRQELDRFRHVLFTGKSPVDFTPKTQEEYITYYESRVERDPASERKLLIQASIQLLPLYKKRLTGIASMEQLLTGESHNITYTDEEVLEELYDEVVNIESEDEWQDYLQQFK